MVRAMLLDEAAIDEAITFYTAHVHYGLRYPQNPRWIREHLGADLFLLGIRVNEELISVAWIAKKKDFVYFTLEKDHLIIKNDGAYADSGGWCIRPDYQGRGLFQLLTATVNIFWFRRINKGGAPPLWGRMMGQKDVDGNPLFWNRVGEKVTGLPYRELLELPFGTMEEVIFRHWPKEPMPFREIPQEILEQTLGKTFAPLIEPLNRFIRWGFVELVDRYVPTSLNRFQRTNQDSIRDPEKFFEEALSKTIKALSSS